MRKINNLIEENAKLIVGCCIYIMLTITFLSGVFSSSDFYSNIANYLGNSIGYSIVTNIIAYCFTVKYHMRKHYKVAVVGLFVMNIISLLTVNSNLYNPVYDLWVSLILFVVVLKLALK